MSVAIMLAGNRTSTGRQLQETEAVRVFVRDRPAGSERGGHAGAEGYGYSALGRSYDLLEERDEALAAYREGVRPSAALGFPAIQQVMLFHGFLEVSYPRGHSLHLAALTGDRELVNELLRDRPTIVSARDAYRGLTPIVWASQRQRPPRPIVERLVEQARTWMCATKRGGRCSRSSVNGNAELADYLASKGAK
jgi:hypothetical protein